MSDLVDQVRIGRPLQTSKDRRNSTADGNACSVVLKLFWNDGHDKIDCPLLLQLICKCATREVGSEDGRMKNPELCPINR